MTELITEDFYAAKSLMDDKGRRIYFAWTPEREKQSDDELWQTGGDFGIPHEVIAMPDGNLKVKMPDEIAEYYKERKLNYSFETKLGNIKEYGNRALEVSSIGTLSYGFFDVEEQNFMMECNIKASDCADYFGISINTDEDIDNGYLLVLNRATQAASLNKLPAPLDPFWSTLSGKPIIPQKWMDQGYVKKHIHLKMGISSMLSWFLRIRTYRSVYWRNRWHSPIEHITKCHAESEYLRRIVM